MLNLAHVNLFHQKNRAILRLFKALEFPTWASTPNSPHRALERPSRSHVVDLPPNDLASEEYRLAAQGTTATRQTML